LHQDGREVEKIGHSNPPNNLIFTIVSVFSIFGGCNGNRDKQVANGITTFTSVPTLLLFGELRVECDFKQR
jgi:hypothetical protein